MVHDGAWYQATGTYTCDIEKNIPFNFVQTMENHLNKLQICCLRFAFSTMPLKLVLKLRQSLTKSLLQMKYQLPLKPSNFPDDSVGNNENATTQTRLVTSVDPKSNYLIIISIVIVLILLTILIIAIIQTVLI